MRRWFILLLCPWLALAAAKPLSPGDKVPDCPLVDQYSKPFQLSQFKGQPVAVTFIFTRCSMPDYCPLMSARFKEAQQITAKEKKRPWRFLTISFDPDHDTPAVLKAYAKAQGADQDSWTFATGKREDIHAFGASFGLSVSEKQGLIDHNLRTVVIDAEGRVQHVFSGNKWTAAELLWELKKAVR